MTYQEFQYLDEDEQAIVCWEEGVRVAERSEPGFIYLLFQLGAFYIEAQYNITLNVIRSYNSFDSMNELDPYLKEIAVEGLL